ncbi:MAG: phosphoglycerate kinase [Desulfobacterales bacterium]
MKKTIRDIDVSGKRVLVRADFNLPIKDGNITDDTRIRKTLPTIEFLKQQGARIIICSHLGRPKGKVVEEFRLDPVAHRLSEYLKSDIIKVDDIIGDDAQSAVKKLKDGDIVVLENTRFNPGEKENDPEFARKLAQFADVFVNDAFGAAHRAHASTVGVARYLPAVAGLLMAEEINSLEKVLTEPKKPFAAIFGGAKVSDKIDVIGRFLDMLDMLLIGGGMANTFLAAKGVPIGASKVETELLDTAAKITEQAGDRLFLPVDVVTADRLDENAETKTVDVNAVPSDWLILDIGPKTIKRFEDKLQAVNMIVWNGPVGVFEMAPFAEGTLQLARVLSGLSAVTIIGGGDSAAAVAKAGVTDEISHISTGGGAFLEFLSGKELPGIQILADKS